MRVRRSRSSAFGKESRSPKVPYLGPWTMKAQVMLDMLAG